MWKWFLGPNLVTKVDRLSTYSAALAYCIVLSLVPFFIVTFVVGTRLALELDLKQVYYTQHYAEVLGNIIPDEQQAKSIIQTVQAVEDPKNGKRGWLFAIGFLIALYTSYNLMDQIVRTLLFIFDDPRRPHEWGWMTMVKTIGLLLLWMTLLLVLSISAVETAFLRHLLDSFNLTSFAREVTTASQVLITIGALFGTFYITYFVVPTRSHRRGVVVEGSLLASMGWIICSLVFANIMPGLLKTSAAYLALGSVVAILIWAQACAWSIILGACWIVRFSVPKR
jgi:YihY family inner membrane protein